MKIDMSFLAAFLLIGTDLLARASVQGVEPALVSTAIEYGSAGLPVIEVGESEQEEPGLAAEGCITKTVVEEITSVDNDSKTSASQNLRPIVF